MEAKIKNSTKNSRNRKFEMEYEEIFFLLNINPDKVAHEWRKNGDTIKEFSAYDKNSPTPIITPNTFSINY